MIPGREITEVAALAQLAERDRSGLELVTVPADAGTRSFGYRAVDRPVSTVEWS
jgi:hypothetical protein